LSENPAITYQEVPRFPPECFAYLHNPLPSNYKRFQKGLDQLVQEGLVHLFTHKNAAQKNVILGAVGPLQFDLVQFRLESEYGAASRLEAASWKKICWLDLGTNDEASIKLPLNSVLVQDNREQCAVLFESEWHVRYFSENNPLMRLTTMPTSTGFASAISESQ
jgi:peptide chain release factor 3